MYQLPPPPLPSPDRGDVKAREDASPGRPPVRCGAVPCRAVPAPIPAQPAAERGWTRARGCVTPRVPRRAGKPSACESNFLQCFSLTSLHKRLARPRHRLPAAPARHRLSREAAAGSTVLRARSGKPPGRGVWPKRGKYCKTQGGTSSAIFRRQPQPGGGRGPLPAGAPRRDCSRSPAYFLRGSSAVAAVHTPRAAPGVHKRQRRAPGACSPASSPPVPASPARHSAGPAPPGLASPAGVRAGGRGGSRPGPGSPRPGHRRSPAPAPRAARRLAKLVSLVPGSRRRGPGAPHLLLAAAGKVCAVPGARPCAAAPRPPPRLPYLCRRRRRRWSSSACARGPAPRLSATAPGWPRGPWRRGPPRRRCCPARWRLGRGLPERTPCFSQCRSLGDGELLHSLYLLFPARLYGRRQKGESESDPDGMRACLAVTTSSASESSSPPPLPPQLPGAGGAAPGTDPPPGLPRHGHGGAAGDGLPARGWASQSRGGSRLCYCPSDLCSGR